MPNLDPSINQQNTQNEEFTTPSKFENQLLSIRDERQEMIRPNCDPTYNERHQKINNHKFFYVHNFIVLTNYLARFVYTIINY